MNTQQIVDTLDAEIRRLEQARTLLLASLSASNGSLTLKPATASLGRHIAAGHHKLHHGRKPKVMVGGKVKRHLSADARARIVAAQRRRWARVKREKKAAQVAAD